MMVGMAGFDMPMWIIRRQIASAIQIVIQVARLTGGMRRVVRISEITGMEGEIISMHDLFGFKQTGIDDDRIAQGFFHATGIRPRCLERLEVSGARLPVEMFERRLLSG
jgi:pilus assembly protein CpaF